MKLSFSDFAEFFIDCHSFQQYMSVPSSLIKQIDVQRSSARVTVFFLISWTGINWQREEFEAGHRQLAAHAFNRSYQLQTETAPDWCQGRESATFTRAKPAPPSV